MENICSGKVSSVGREESAGTLTYRRDEKGIVVWCFPPDAKKQTTFSVDEPDGGKLHLTFRESTKTPSAEADDNNCIKSSSRNFMISETGSLNQFTKSAITGPGEVRQSRLDSYPDDNFPPIRAGNGSMQSSLREGHLNPAVQHDRVCENASTKPEVALFNPQYSPLTPPATPKKSPRVQGHIEGQGYDHGPMRVTPTREVTRFQFSDHVQKSTNSACHKETTRVVSLPTSHPDSDGPGYDGNTTNRYVGRGSISPASAQYHQRNRQTSSVKATTFQQLDELPPKSPILSRPLDDNFEVQNRLWSIIHHDLDTDADTIDDVKPITLQDPPKPKQKKNQVHWEVGQASQSGFTAARYSSTSPDTCLSELEDMGFSKTDDDRFNREPFLQYSTQGRPSAQQERHQQCDRAAAGENVEETGRRRSRTVYPDVFKIPKSSLSSPICQAHPLKLPKSKLPNYQNQNHFVFPSVQYRGGDESLSFTGRTLPVDSLFEGSRNQPFQFSFVESNDDQRFDFLGGNMDNNRNDHASFLTTPNPSSPSNLNRDDRFHYLDEIQTGPMRSEIEQSDSGSIFPKLPSKARRRVLSSPMEAPLSPCLRPSPPDFMHPPHPFFSRMPPPSPTSHMPPPSPTLRRVPPASPTSKLYPPLSPVVEHLQQPLPPQSFVIPLSPTRQQMPPRSPDRRYVSPPSTSPYPSSLFPVRSRYHRYSTDGTQRVSPSPQSSANVGRLRDMESSYPRSTLPRQDNPWDFSSITHDRDTDRGSQIDPTAAMRLGNPRRRLFNSYETIQQQGHSDEEDEALTHYILSHLVSRNILTSEDAHRLQQNATEKQRAAGQRNQQHRHNYQQHHDQRLQPHEQHDSESSLFVHSSHQEAALCPRRVANSSWSHSGDIPRNLRHSMGEVEESIFARSNAVDKCSVLARTLLYQRSQSLPSPNESSTPDRRAVNRKRRRGDIDIHVECEEIVREPLAEDLTELRRVHTGSEQCECADVEDQILRMAQEAYANIRRANESPEAFEQFENELHQTNDTIHEAMKILRALKELCTQGRSIEKIYSGSVVITLHCPTLSSLEDLWESHINGRLQETIQEGFITDSLREKFKAKEMSLKVSITESHYQVCKEELENSILEQLVDEDEQLYEENAEANNENTPVPGLLTPKKIRTSEVGPTWTSQHANYGPPFPDQQTDLTSAVPLRDYDISTRSHPWRRSPNQPNYNMVHVPKSQRSPHSPKSSKAVRNLGLAFAVDPHQLSPLPNSPNRKAFQELNRNISSSFGIAFDSGKVEFTEPNKDGVSEEYLAASL